MMENLGELFAALAAARQEFGTLTKGKTATIKSDKGNYGYTYADLSDVIEATGAALAKHGLVIIQEPEVINEGGRQTVVISGCIAHKSGGVYTLKPLPLPVAGSTAQAIGSAISYARRYQLTAVLNLAAADDDGAEASNEPQDNAKPSRPAQQARPQPARKAQGATTTPQRTVDAATGEITVSDVSTDAELEILGTWQTPQDAQAWAVKNGACGNEFEARTSFAKVVDAHGGKLTKENIAVVYLDYLRKQNGKLAERKVAA
jgi:hypothetical protein